MNIVQYLTSKHQKHVALVEGDRLRDLPGIDSSYQLMERAIAEGSTLAQMINRLAGDHLIDYQEVIEAGNLLPPIDHPDPYHLWITGTGLTHLGSADARDKMHQDQRETDTDSSRMFKLGLSDGKPGDNQLGVQPEWFYKGNGTVVVNPGGVISLPSFSDSGSEEVEVCAIHLIGSNGVPMRVGYALGNEFSDHVMEKKNYLYLAHSKLRPCSFGPELLVGELPQDIRGTVSVVRESKTIWEKPFLTGEDNMCHSLRNLEYHHFKYDIFRHPGDLHVHFLGTATLSFSDQVELQENDIFKLEAPVLGKPLENSLKLQGSEGISISDSLLR